MTLLQSLGIITLPMLPSTAKVQTYLMYVPFEAPQDLQLEVGRYI